MLQQTGSLACQQNDKNSIKKQTTIIYNLDDVTLHLNTDSFASMPHYPKSEVHHIVYLAAQPSKTVRQKKNNQMFL